jgi:cytochrome c oxidase subunit IV
MESSQQHHASIKSYILVLATLTILTGSTVGLSYMGIPHEKAIVIAAIIAITKCTLIAGFFMHLRFERKGIIAILLSALFLVGVLILAILPDIGIIK